VGFLSLALAGSSEALAEEGWTASMVLQDLVIRYALTPQIVDRQPGALRVRLPPGIESVEPEDGARTLLFRYNPETIGEKEVLTYLYGLLALVYRYSGRFAKLTPERTPEVIDRIEQILTDAIRDQVDIGKDVSIPDDVWA
jgi:hypothetical protein